MLVGIACMVGALANWNDTSTGIDLEKLPHPPLIKIWSGPLKDGARATFDGITAEADRSPREVRLHSAGKSGKAWEVHMCCLDEVWRADLDGNGTPDYIFFSNGPYFNGRTTPLFSMSILLMDSQGLPVPFFTVVYQGENGGGTNGLVDLDHDGRAELLISTYDEAVSDPHAGVFSSGHWVTQLYRFRNLRVEEFRGTMGGLTFPFVHAWTYRGREGAATGNPLPVQSPVLYEHGTGTDGEVSTFIRSKKDARLDINPVSGCRTIEPRTVVYDRNRVREIAFVNLWSSASDDLLEAIRRDSTPIRLSGLDKWMHNGDCSPNLIWATQGDH